MHETNGQHGLCGIPSIWDDQPKWPKMQKPAGHMQRRSGAMSLGCLRHGKITWDISRVGLKRLGHLAGAKIQPEMAIGYISDSFKWTDNGWLVVVDHQDHSKKQTNTHRIHGAGIYANIYHQYTPNVSIYTSTMDPMGNMLILRASHSHPRSHPRIRPGNQEKAGSNSTYLVCSCFPGSSAIQLKASLKISCKQKNR